MDDRGAPIIRVFLVDDHEIARRGVAQLVSAEPDMRVVGESDCAGRTVRRVTATRPHVVIVDVLLPDGNGVDLCREILSAHPGMHCLMLTAGDVDARSAALAAGASGYLLKTVPGKRLIASIRRVARDHSTGTVVPPSSVEPSNAAPVLTLRERQALHLIAEGLTNRQIGDRLNLSEKTIKNYVSGLYRKLGMHRRAQVAAYAANHPLA